MMIISELFTRKKGLTMNRTNKVVYKEVLRLFSVFLFVTAIFGGWVSVCADDCNSGSKVDSTGSYVSEGLMLYNELTHESGRNFIRARKNLKDLLNIYLGIGG